MNSTIDYYDGNADEYFVRTSDVTFDEIYSRLKEDPEIMDNDYKAEFLYMLRLMKRYKETYNYDIFE